MIRNMLSKHALESGINVAVGFPASVAITYILADFFGSNLLATPFEASVMITAVFVSVSFLRTFIIRIGFSRWYTK